MVTPAVDDFESSLIDLDAYEQESAQAFEKGLVDLDSIQQQPEDAPTWTSRVGEFLTQAGLGAARVFTWPADVLKAAMIGEGLSDIEELEENLARFGQPFDREGYVKNVMEQASYLPTQDLLEQGFEKATGISLQPKTELGKATRQAAGLAAFTPGGVARKLATGAAGALATQGLKAAGVDEGKAELIGDVATLPASAVRKGPRALSQASQELKKTADKYSLPFLEYMAREKAPLFKGRMTQATEKTLQDQFGMSTQKAMSKILDNELPIKRVRDRGVNLDTLAEHAYTKTRQVAQARPGQVRTQSIVADIDKEVSRIQNLAPSPSDAQRAAIDLLNREKAIFKKAKPTPEQLINQHINYNADMKSIYRKPEFSGKEDEVRRAYELLKTSSINALEQQGYSDVANSFRAANKIYHEASKLEQSERLLSKAFKGDSYNPKRLQSVLQGRDGKFLTRNLGKGAVKDLEEIANYGAKAEKAMDAFLNISKGSIVDQAASWGELAPLVLVPGKIKGAAVAAIKPLAQYVQGKLLTRPATREAYKMTLKHAAEGSFNLLKKDFALLEREISKEYGDVDTFLDGLGEDLEILELE